MSKMPSSCSPMIPSAAGAGCGVWWIHYAQHSDAMNVMHNVNNELI